MATVSSYVRTKRTAPRFLGSSPSYRTKQSPLAVHIVPTRLRTGRDDRVTAGRPTSGIASDTTADVPRDG